MAFKIVHNPETAILLSRQEGRMPKGDLSCEGQRANLMFLHYACMRAFAKEIMEKANSFDKWNASRRRKKRSVSLENRAPSAEGKRGNLIIGPPRARESPTPLTFFWDREETPSPHLNFFTVSWRTGLLDDENFDQPWAGNRKGECPQMRKTCY